MGPQPRVDKSSLIRLPAALEGMSKALQGHPDLLVTDEAAPGFMTLLFGQAVYITGLCPTLWRWLNHWGTDSNWHQ